MKVINNYKQQKRHSLPSIFFQCPESDNHNQFNDVRHYRNSKNNNSKNGNTDNNTTINNNHNHNHNNNRRSKTLPELQQYVHQDLINYYSTIEQEYFNNNEQYHFDNYNNYNNNEYNRNVINNFDNNSKNDGNYISSRNYNRNSNYNNNNKQIPNEIYQNLNSYEIVTKRKKRNSKNKK
ncbi:hypothetical protein ABK040_011249 [Willaertia magna]